MARLAPLLLLATAALAAQEGSDLKSDPSARDNSKIYSDAVAHAGRSSQDRERDARELPAEVMAFAGFKPGMKVADVFGGGGYYSELISYVVGPKGEVALVNNVPYANYAGDEGKARFTPGRLPNVRRSVIESCDLKLGKESFDAILIVLSYHDLYHADPLGGWPEIDAAHFLDQLHAALKPQGIFLIVDHAAKAGTGKTAAQQLHRIDESFARSDIASHGFAFEGSFDKLRNPNDDYSKVVFDQAVRFKTDRFVHLYRKK
jgi:predicted methyltransferase